MFSIAIISSTDSIAHSTKMYVHSHIAHYKKKCTLVTNHSINGHIEELPGSDNVEDLVNVLKNKHHHLVFILWSRSGEIRRESQY